MRRAPLILFFATALYQMLQAASSEIPFELHEGLLWVKATANSGELFNLLLDTGAGASVLNITAANRLGLKHGRAISVRGVGTALEGYSLKPIPLVAGQFQLPAPSLSVDLQKLGASCERPVDGLIGADFFRGRIVQIDFDALKICTLSDAADQPSADTLPLQFRPCGMRVPVAVNGCKPQWFRLDTGCVSSLQWVTSTVRASDCNRKTAIGLTEISIPQTDTTVQIGSLEFQNVPTGLHDKPIFQGEAGLLGNGILSRFSKVTIDAKSGHLILESRSR